MVVPAVHALAELVVEPAEVTATLAVHPTKVTKVVVVALALDIGELHLPGLNPPPAGIHLQFGGDVDDGHDALGGEDRTFAAGGAPAGILKEESGVVGELKEHPLARARMTVAGRWGTVGARPATPGLVAPGVIAEERGRRRIELDSLSSDGDRPVADAGDLVGHTFAEQASIEPFDFDRAHVRHDRARAGQIEGDTDLVVIEGESYRLHRLDDLQVQRPNAQLVHPWAQAARDTDVVLAAFVAQAHEAVEHVVVGVQPQV